MGAIFQSVSFPFEKSQTKELEKAFSKYQDQECYEGGHNTYAGHLGIKEGLTIHDKVFQSWKAANDFIEEHNEKWESADAVFVEEGGKSYWYVGGWCAC